MWNECRTPTFVDQRGLVLTSITAGPAAAGATAPVPPRFQRCLVQLRLVVGLALLRDGALRGWRLDAGFVVVAGGRHDC